MPRTSLDGKRRRLARRELLQCLLHEGAVSNTGLRSILASLELQISQRELIEAHRGRLEALQVTASFPLTSGKEFVLTYVDPVLYLADLIGSSPSLQALYAAAFRAHRGQVWRVAVAFDEWAPGNKLKVDNRRKAMNVYVTFLELGQAAMSEAVCWIVPMVVRHEKLVGIVGGWPRVLKVFLDRLLYGPHGLTTAGLPLQLAGESVVVRARLACILSDGEGLKYACDWKGSSGLKPCIQHFNVLKRGSDLAHRRQGFCEVPLVLM